MNYQFDMARISQHVVKYGVHIHPPITLKDEKARLQDYCNRLIEQFGQVFETLLLGPNQLRVHKSFQLAKNKRIDMPTFVLTARGPLYTMPRRLYIDEIQDVHIPERNKIFRRALEELRSSFADRTVKRVDVIHELVFDTEAIDSVELIASSLRHDLWRERIKNLRLLLETPTRDKNVNLEIKPTHLRRARGPVTDVGEQAMGFGIIVNVFINNRQLKDDLTRAEINDILAFADDYVPEELIKFLNNEY